MVVHVTEVLSCAFNLSHDRLHGVVLKKELSRHGAIGTIVVGFAKYASFISSWLNSYLLHF